MLRLLDGAHRSAFLDFCGKDAVGAVISTRLRTYGTDDPHVFFWYAGEDGAVTGAASAYEGEFSGTAENDEIYGEMRALAEFTSCSRVLLYSDLLSDESRRLMRCVPGDRDVPVLPEGAELRALSSEELPAAYKVIFPGSEAVSPLWLTDVSHKLRHGLIRGKTVIYEGKPVSLCLTSGETEELAVISAVSTLPEHRGRGYASAAVAALARELASGGRGAVLICPAELEGFYSRIGFVDFYS